MSSKNLELGVKYDTSQAERAIKWLIDRTKEAGLTEKEFQKRVETAEYAIDTYRKKLDWTTAAKLKFKAAATSALWGISSAAQAATSALWWVMKTGVLAVGAVGWVLAWRAAANVYSFSKEYGLMSATLRQKSWEAKTQLQNDLLDISSRTGKTVEEVTKAMTQLYSSGLKPTAKEFNADGSVNANYLKQLKDVSEVTELIGKASLATGEDMVSLQNAVVYMSNAFGKSLSSPKDVKEVLNTLGATLDAGIGTMSQYSDQFSKFWPAAASAGIGMKEISAVFAGFTRIMNPELAGLVTKRFAEEFSSAGRYASTGANILGRQMKQGLVKGTKEDMWLLKSLSGKALVNMFSDDKWQARSMTETIGMVAKAYDKLSSTSAKGAFLDAIAPNDSMKKAWRELLSKREVNGKMTSGADEIINSILPTFWGKEFDTLMETKFNTANEGFNVKWDRFRRSMDNNITKVGLALSPAVGALFDVVSMKMQGQTIDQNALASLFAQAKTQIMATYPALAPVVGLMEQITKWMASDDANKFIANIGTAMQIFSAALWKVADGLAMILESPVAQYIAYQLWEEERKKSEQAAGSAYIWRGTRPLDDVTADFLWRWDGRSWLQQAMNPTDMKAKQERMYKSLAIEQKNTLDNMTWPDVNVPRPWLYWNTKETEAIIGLMNSMNLSPKAREMASSAFIHGQSSPNLLHQDKLTFWGLEETLGRDNTIALAKKYKEQFTNDPSISWSADAIKSIDAYLGIVQKWQEVDAQRALDLYNETKLQSVTLQNIDTGVRNMVSAIQAVNLKTDWPSVSTEVPPSLRPLATGTGWSFLDFSIK